MFLNYQPVFFIMLLFISPAPTINKVMGECSLLKQWPSHRNSMIEAKVPILNLQVKALLCKTYFSWCEWAWPLLPLRFAIRSPLVEATSCERNLQERAQGWGDQVWASLQLHKVPIFHGASLSVGSLVLAELKGRGWVREWSYKAGEEPATSSHPQQCHQGAEGWQDGEIPGSRALSHTVPSTSSSVAGAQRQGNQSQLLRSFLISGKEQCWAFFS